MSEEWRDIPGWPGYQASSEGQVRSLRHPEPRILAGRVDRDGYRRVHIMLGKERREVPVHQLVLFAFVGPRPEGMETRHIHGDPSDNRPSSLAWGTHIENNRDRVRHGTHHNVAKTHCPARHPYDEANTYIGPNGKGRVCRECKRTRNRERELAARLARSAA